MIGEWIRFGIVACLMISGVIALFISIFGTFRFNFALNRIHAASMVDTVVLILFILACIIAEGFTFTSAKFLLIVFIQWCTAPLVSHMLAKYEYMTDTTLAEHCKLPDDEIKKEEE